MIKCIVVDDELIAHQILEKYILKCESLALIGHCRNAMEALAMLEAHEVDLIFLDIQMPLISGLTFLKNLNNPPQIIFTTAFQDYALQGFELNAVDYLLKPFSYERFLKAVGKAEKLLENRSAEKSDENYFIIESNSVAVKLLYKDILYIEALGDYMKIYTPEKFYLQHTTLKLLEEQLPNDKFIRVHKSYIVAIGKIKMIAKDELILSNDIHVPIGQSHKEKLNEVFRK
ncbi:hypothetical protein A9P82_05260 [Arachidicoccus ginsenosidimutans]|uniref:LytR/AlgR family response regulator transcription factor n=1 Tax=Arachidicoccus sp. BS20 TaxID=1850526 RepID=UPI0007F11FA7|nr:LytTR family DNA-binding domain-containing protein [Arachidicoccus sp. BS20]ANI88744.1 hypothetical protein A9P82_05260 [Arachidicoccus sp. BS20]